MSLRSLIIFGLGVLTFLSVGFVVHFAVVALVLLLKMVLEAILFGFLLVLLFRYVCK